MERSGYEALDRIEKILVLRECERVGIVGKFKLKTYSNAVYIAKKYLDILGIKKHSDAGAGIFIHFYERL